MEVSDRGCADRLASSQHDRLNVERRLSEAPVGSMGSQVRTSDVARLMELFQVRALPQRRTHVLTNADLPS
jgi:hypothetical protein